MKVQPAQRPLEKGEGVDAQTKDKHPGENKVR